MTRPTTDPRNGHHRDWVVFISEGVLGAGIIVLGVLMNLDVICLVNLFNAGPPSCFTAWGHLRIYQPFWWALMAIGAIIVVISLAGYVLDHRNQTGTR